MTCVIQSCWIPSGHGSAISGGEGSISFLDRSFVFRYVLSGRVETSSARMAIQVATVTMLIAASSFIGTPAATRPICPFVGMYDDPQGSVGSAPLRSRLRRMLIYPAFLAARLAFRAA